MPVSAGTPGARSEIAGISPDGNHPWAREPITRQEMLIVGGGYRCGTSSLFSYLADHPEVSPSLIKEPAFFFSLRLKERPQTSYPPGHEVWAYLSMFRRRNARVLLEGTSNYLNDPGCAARIARLLPNAKVILMLREPVERLVSWYKFLRLQAYLEPGLSFEQWIRSQLADSRPLDQRPYPLQAIEHCRYSRYVSEFLETLGAERVLIVWFDDFKRDPRATMRRICAFAGITPDYYADFEFRAHNESMAIARPRMFAAYRRLHRAFFRLLKPWPRLQHELKVLLFGLLEPRILPFFTGPAAPVRVERALREEIISALRSDVPSLRNVVGTEVPWQSAYEQAEFAQPAHQSV